MRFRCDAFQALLPYTPLSRVLSLVLLLLFCLDSGLQEVAALPFTESIRRGLAQPILPRQGTDSNFTTSNFVRIAFHSSVILGNTLYIDGGEVCSTEDGQLNKQVPNNDTLSIDLSQSWTPGNATISPIAKDDNVPVLIWESLWPAMDNESFYLWAGSVSRSLPDANDRNPPNGLWQFKNGAWSQVDLNAGSIFPSLNRPSGGASTSGNGVGYYLGGYDADFNPESNGPFVPTPGFVSYNMTSNTWKNASALGYDYDGTAHFGGLQYIPTFGSEGLLAAFGGEASSPTSWLENGENLQSFSNIAVYDPSGSGQWYSQQATGYNGPGDIPTPSDMFCSVGVQSDEGTYEIFMYGGHSDAYINGFPAPDATQQQAQGAFNHVYVLSLPGFVWFKVNDTSAEPRTGHTCEVVGNRQMLSIGGLNPQNHSAVNYSDPDTSPQGLGVFDMVQLEWTHAYDANAAPYTAPDVVKEWYSRPNSNSSVQWSSPQLKDLFSHTSTPASPGTNPSAPPPPSTSSSTASSSMTGKIAGAVIGPVVGVAVIAAAIWFFVRRRIRRGQPLSSAQVAANAPNSKKTPPADDYPPEKQREAWLYSEMGGSPTAYEMGHEPAAQELASPVEPQELASPTDPPKQELVSPIHSRGPTYELG